MPNEMNQYILWATYWVIFDYTLSVMLQVVAHMMPDLPNVGLERDIEQFIVSCFLFLSINLCRGLQLNSLLHYF